MKHAPGKTQPADKKLQDFLARFLGADGQRKHQMTPSRRLDDCNPPGGPFLLL
jgi:hypothetical protein